MDVNLLASPYGNPKRDDEIDVHALVGTLLDRKWLIIGVIAVFFLISLAYVFFATPVYQAQAMVQIEQAPNVTGPSAVPQSAYAPNNPGAADALSLLTARAVVKKPVDDFNMTLVASPSRFPLIGNYIARNYTPAKAGEVASPWLGLSRYGWGGSKLKFTRLEVPNSLLGEKLSLVAEQNGNFSLWDDSIIPGQSRLLLRGKVGQLAKGSGITALVKTLHANPGTHFEVVRNGEIYTIDQLALAIQAQQPGKTDSNVIAVSLNSQSPQQAVKILDEVTRAYVEQNSRRNSAQAASSLQFVRQQLPAVQAKLQTAQDALNAFQVKAHSVDVPMQTQSLVTQVAAIDTSIQQLETQRAEAARLYTPEHPAYKAIMTQIGQLQAQKADMERQINTFPDTQRELLRLTGNVQVLNTTYTNLLNEAQQLELAQAGTLGDVRIVDPAAVDITTPVKPRKLITVLGATFLGAFFAVGYVFLRKMLNRSVEDPFEIERLGLPVYTAIPLSERQVEISQHAPRLFGRRQQRLLALAAPQDLAAEALRGLRTNLHFAQPDARDNRLMICGSSPGAGKTFVSTNLAAVNAQAGQRVLLIDANMRDGELHTILGGRAENGLSDLIAGRLDIDDAIRPVEGLDNLHFIACGRTPPNPSELLMHPDFSALLRQLSPRYDLIVIDSPPILAVTDAAIIGQHVGTSLLVVRFGLNQTREVELAQQRFKRSGVNIDGVVFNGTEKRSGGYSAYGSYGYYGIAS